MAWAAEPASPSLANASSRVGGATPGRPELGLDPVGRRLLGRRQADRVPGAPDLVLVDDEDAGRREALEEREEDALLEAPEPRPELLLRHPRLERLARVEGGQRRLGLPARDAPPSPRGRTTPGRRRRRARAPRAPGGDPRSASGPNGVRARSSAVRAPPPPTRWMCASRTDAGGPRLEESGDAPARAGLRRALGGATSRSSPPPSVTTASSPGSRSGPGAGPRRATRGGTGRRSSCRARSRPQSIDSRAPGLHWSRGGAGPACQ